MRGQRRIYSEKIRKVYFISFLISFFLLLAVDGFDGPGAVRIDLFRFFSKRWIQLVLIQVVNIIITTCDCSCPARSCKLAQTMENPSINLGRIPVRRHRILCGWPCFRGLAQIRSARKRGYRRTRGRVYAKVVRIEGRRGRS